MIKRASEMPRTVKPQMRGGDGQAVVTNLLDAGEYQGKSRMIATITLEPGCSIGEHVHEKEEEVFYIIQGTATYDDNGTETVLHPATLAFAWAVKSTRLPTGQRMKRLFCMR